MSEDARRTRRQHDEEGDFGPPLFAEPEESDSGEIASGLSFGASDTGPLPHWTEPPTGEMPRTLTTAAPADPSDDLDVWSSFAGKAPVWSDDQPVDPHDETNEIERVAPTQSVGDDTDDITARD